MSKKLNNGLKAGVYEIMEYFMQTLKTMQLWRPAKWSFLFTQMMEIIKIMMHQGQSTWGMITYMKKYTFVSE